MTGYLLAHPDRVREGLQLATVQAVNRAAREQFGLQDSKIDLDVMLAMLVENAPGGFPEQFGAIATGVLSMTVDLLHKNFGADRVFRVHQVIPLEDGQPDLARVSVGVLDLSLEKKAERLLKKSLVELARERDRFERMFENSPVPIRLNDLRTAVDSFEELRLGGVSDFGAYAREHPEEVDAVVSQIIVTAVNPAATKLFGSDRGELVGPLGGLESVFAGMALNSFQNLGCDVHRIVPMPLIPPLELSGFGPALNLDVEFDIVRQPRNGEIRGAHKRLGTYHVELPVGDVGLRVELVLVVYADFNLARLQSFDDCRCPS